MRIDAHQHFWKIDRGDYDWMTDEVALIRRDILPADLIPHLQARGINGTILVQAAATEAETHFLLDLAKKFRFIRGVVGWVDLDQINAATSLQDLAKDPILKGVRPMLQDISATDWILRPKVMQNLRILAHLGLRLDALVTSRHLPALLEVARAIPELPIVIDHCAKPVIAGGRDAGYIWCEQMTALAKQPQVFCKISGLANEYGAGWNAAALQTTTNFVISAFGAPRVMWGSDWPVLDLVGSYASWDRATNELLANYTAAEQAEIRGGTAQRFYGLGKKPA